MQNNLFFEMCPLIAFFAVYYFTKDIFLATAVCIGASWLQIAFYKFKYNKVNKNTWISTALISILGGLTIAFHNKTFVMLKPTILFWIIGASMLVGQMLGKNGIKLMLSKEISLSSSLWKSLNVAWASFFIVMGGLNLFVAMNFSEYIWVKFKVFGSLGLTIIFSIISFAIVILMQKKKL